MAILNVKCDIVMNSGFVCAVWTCWIVTLYKAYRQKK